MGKYLLTIWKKTSSKEQWNIDQLLMHGSDNRFIWLKIVPLEIRSLSLTS